MGRNTWIHNSLALLSFLFLFAYSFSAYSAVTYYWYNSYFKKSASSPQGVCDAIGPNLTAVNDSPTSGYCTQNGKVVSGTAYGRIGDSCPAGSTYDPVTYQCKVTAAAGSACVGSGQASSGFGFIINIDGQCVDYVNADLPSQCKNLGGTSAPHTLYVNFDDDGNPINPPPITAGGCAAVAAGVSHCVKAPKRVFPTGGSIQPTGNKCKVLVSFTGAVGGDGNKLPVVGNAPGDGNALCKGDCPDVPPAPVQNDTKPCTYVEDGEGRKVCASSNFNYTPGNSSCGTVNGTFQCVGKAPTTNGISIGTTISETTNPDGTKTSVKKDTATQIVCNSPKPCVSNVTTNTTTTTYNSNGAKTGQSTSCTGPACSTDGKGDKDGDGLSDCVVGKCEEGTPVGGQDWYEKGEETYGSAFQSFADRVSASPVMKAGDKFFAFNPGGSCPVWSVNTWVFSITLDQHCSTDIPWDAIKAIIIACASFVAFRWALL